MADTYHAIKLYKTTANSTTSSKRVGINVTDSTVTTGYALYVNGAINITDSLKTNSLNTGDLVVTGSASFTNGVNGITAANVPNLDASKITSGTLGVARGGTGATTFTSGAALIGAGTGAITTRSITNNTSATAAATNTNLITNNTLYYATASINNARQTSSVSIYAPTSAGTSGYILKSNGGTSAPTWIQTVPVANGGTGVTSIANIKAGKDGDGNTISSTYLKLSGGTLTGDLTFSGEAPFIYFDDNSKHYGAIYTYDGVVIRNYATNNVNYEDYSLPTPGAITANGDYEILTSKLTRTFTDEWNDTEPKSSTLFSSITTGSSMEATVFQWGKLIHISLVISRAAATAAGSNLFQATLRDEYLPYGRVSGAAYYGSCGILGVIFGENDGDANEKKTIKIRVVGSTLPADGSVGIGFFYMLKN